MLLRILQTPDGRSLCRSGADLYNKRRLISFYVQRERREHETKAFFRSYFGRLIPDKRRAGEFFGLYNIFGKFESVMGTALMSAVITATGNVNYGVIPILGVFLVGAALLAMVKDDSRNAGIVDGE